MLGFRFSYMYKLHAESFMGFNAVCLPGNPPGAFYRSSLPATPVSTPIRENGRFSAQALRERLCRTPSPRKYRLFEPRASEPDIGFNSLDVGLQLSSPDDEIDEETPFNITKLRMGQRLSDLKIEKESTIASRLKRRVFVGNLGHFVKKKDLQEFFSKFGKVMDCLIIQDQVMKRTRGYGFIVFSNQEDAEKARLATPSQLEFDGRVLRVLPCKEKACSKYRQEARELLFAQNVENGACVHYSGNYGTFMRRLGGGIPLDNINLIDDILLIRIFSFLGIREKLVVEQVCKRWRTLMKELWSTNSEFVLSRDYGLFHEKKFTNETLCFVLNKSAPYLTKLDLRSPLHYLDYKCIEIITTFCPELEFVDLTTVKMTNVSLHQLAGRCVHLKHVVMQDTIEVGEKGIWWLLHLCKNLEHVDVSGNTRISGQCFHMAGPEMKAIILNGCSRFSPSGFSKIATKCHQLETLQLNNCSLLTNRALEMLCQSLRNLKELHVGGDFLTLGSDGLHHIGRLSNLESLSLCSNKATNDDVVYAISRGCRRLRYLDISDVPVTDVALSSLSTCYQLRKLYMNYLDKITDEGLSLISRHGMLEFLRMKGCPNIGDQGLLSLILLSPHLAELDLSGCDRVTNATVTACLDSVQARTLQKKLLLIVGGTSVELEALELVSKLLVVSRANNCDMSLCKSRTFDAIDDDDPNAGNLLPDEEGAVGGNPFAYAEVEDPPMEPFWGDEL